MEPETLHEDLERLEADLVVDREKREERSDALLRQVEAIRKATGARDLREAALLTVELLSELLANLLGLRMEIYALRTTALTLDDTVQEVGDDMCDEIEGLVIPAIKPLQGHVGTLMAMLGNLLRHHGVEKTL